MPAEESNPYRAPSTWGSRTSDSTRYGPIAWGFNGLGILLLAGILATAGRWSEEQYSTIPGCCAVGALVCTSTLFGPSRVHATGWWLIAAGILPGLFFVAWLYALDESHHFGARFLAGSAAGMAIVIFMRWMPFRRRPVCDDAAPRQR